MKTSDLLCVAANLIGQSHEKIWKLTEATGELVKGIRAEVAKMLGFDPWEFND